MLGNSSSSPGFVAILIAIGLTLTGRVARLVDVMINFLGRRFGIDTEDNSDSEGDDV